MHEPEKGQSSPPKSMGEVCQLFNAVGIALWTCEPPEFRPRWVAAGVDHLIGHRVDSWIDAVPDDERDAVEATLREAFESRTPRNFEHRLRGDGGGVVWVRQMVAPVISGDATVLQGILIDVSEQRDVERALRESEAHLRQITENINEMFWVTDSISQTPLYVSPAFETMTGYSSEDLLEGRITWMALVDPRDRERIVGAMQGIAQGRPYDEELRILRSNGEIRWIHSRGFPVRNENGEVYRLVGVAEDITERRLATETSRETDERLQFVARATTDVLYDWNIGAESVWWSSGYQTQFGYDESGVLPAKESWLNRIHPEDREWVVRTVARAIERRESSINVRYRFRLADGTYAQILDRAFTSFDEAGSPVRMVGAVIDLTRQRQLETQLEQMRRVASLGALAANMAHEFNNVLMGIQPFVDVIRRLVPDNPRVQESAARIGQSIERGRKITGEILHFTRRVQPTRRVTLVGEWLSSFARMIEDLIDGHTLETRIPDPALLVHIDVDQMNQVLTSLILNARDASPQGSVITLAANIDDDSARTGASPGSLHIIITDRGSGVPQDLLERIFEPLFTTKKNVAGLGLAISNQIVEAHEGRIYAENREGGGASFHIVLPLAADGSREPRVKGEGRLPSSVLIVDDERDLAEGLEELLRMAGVRVSSVARGADALGAVLQMRPEVVLLDVALPDVPGPEVYDLIEREIPDQQVIFMSGHFDVSSLHATLNPRKVSFLQKPFDSEDLLDALRRLIANDS